MTATRERQNAPAPESGPAWAERSAFGSARGVPLWAAILLAVVPTTLGTVLDILIWSKAGVLFQVCFLIGCALGVGLVRRESVFGPMVQPPLVASIVMPLIVLLTGSGASKNGGAADKALAVIQPLISSFPIMAATSAITLGFGLVRMLVTQRSDSRDTATDDIDAPTKKKRTPPPPRRSKAAEQPKRRPPEEGAERPPARRRPDGRERPEGRGGRGAPPQEGRPARGRPAAEPPPGGKQQGRPRREAPGPRGEPRPDRGGERATPPGRGRAPRPEPGRGRPPGPPPGGEPPRRPRRPRD